MVGPTKAIARTLTASVLILTSCGLGGGGGSSSLSSTTISAPSSISALGKLAVDKSNNVWIAADIGVLEIPNGTKTCTTASSCPTFTLGYLPKGIAVDSSGNVWVTDDLGNTVTEIVPASANSSCTVGCTTFSGSFSSPIGIAVDSAGNVWVTNSSGPTVTEIPNGATSPCSGCLSFSGSTFFSTPTGIAADSSKNIWVTNNVSSGSVTEITSSSGTPCTSCTTTLGFANPVAVAVTGATPWIANTVKSTYPASIVQITSSCQLSGTCNYISGFSNPTGLAFDSNSNLWVLDSGNNTMAKITSGAILIAKCTTSNPCYQYNLPATPQGIAADSNGNVWVTTTGAQIIQYTP